MENSYFRKPFWFYLAFVTAFPAFLLASPLLMISIDGLQPDDVLDADSQKLQIPNLKSLLEESRYAKVIGVMPTVTYPSHATLITGVPPQLHGISNNSVFDPMGKNKDGYYWYASDIKTQTLWDAVHTKGKRVANLRWPVSVGAKTIDYNIPEFWRSTHPDDLKLLRALSTPDLIDSLQEKTNIPASQLIDRDRLKIDEVVGRFAAEIIKSKHPEFLTLHLVGLDYARHRHGTSSKEAKAALESIDSILGDLIAAAREAEPKLTVAIVSDHGFVDIKQDVHLLAAFVDAGLISIDQVSQKVASWKAFPWKAGGSAAIVLANPKDEETKRKVASLLKELQAKPESGIARVITGAELEASGGGREASYWIDFALGFEMVDDIAKGPLVTPSTMKGMHGYFPVHKQMRAFFMIAGPGIKKGSIGDINMVDIAPTLAKILEVALPQATGRSVL